MKLLGIDWGEKRIGLAISVGDLAEPFGVVSSVEEVVGLIQKEGIGQIVLGLPEGRHEKKVRDFGEKLRVRTGLELIFRSEILSTREALAKAIEAGKSQKDRRNLDALSAALILQEYLDFQKSDSVLKS